MKRKKERGERNNLRTGRSRSGRGKHLKTYVLILPIIELNNLLWVEIILFTRSMTTVTGWDTFIAF